MSPSSSSHIPACFRPSTGDRRPALPLPPPSPPPPPPESTSNNTNLTTCLYQTTLGQFSLTWSRSFLGHSLHLLLHPTTNTTDHYSPSPTFTAASPSASFHLHLKPFNFWKKHGSKKIPLAQATSPKNPTHLRLYWDLTKAKFGSAGPEPLSNFYIAAVVDQELVLLIGDLTKQALSRTKPLKKPYQQDQVLVLRREHVYGDRVYKTRAKFGGKNREITIDCTLNSDAKLSFSVDKERVLLIKRLRWKFRGSEKVEIDGVTGNISWDVYNWLFQGNGSNGHAVFMFKFDTLGVEEEEEEVVEEKKGGALWKLRQGSVDDFGRFGLMMGSRRRRTERSLSSSSISLSSASSSGGGSSVMEWSSVEENELTNPVGFSLLVYAWRK